MSKPASYDELVSSAKQFLVGVFQIVGHTKEESEENFQLIIEKTTQLTVSNLLNSLEIAQKEEVLGALQQKKTPQEGIDLLFSVFSKEEFAQVFQYSFGMILELYFIQINSTLSEDQHGQIRKLIQDLNIQPYAKKK
jgi:hypothetical protein